MWRSASRAWRQLAVAGGAGAATMGMVYCHSAPGADHVHTGMNPKFSHEKHLLLAVPKKGRMAQQIQEMLKGSGFDYKRPERLDIAHCTDLPVSIVFLPAADIAAYVSEGNVDLGITGEDIVAETVAETGASVNVMLELGFGKCRLSLQAPAASGYTDPKELAGKRIVTSFPELTKAFFQKHECGVPTKIKVISGSVEAACGLGLADGIVDLVETGTTMRAAGLEEVSVIMNTQTVLIANPHTEHGELVETLRKRIAGYITASRYMMVTYNVHRKNLDVVKAITPGKKSPSIQPLETPDWVAVSALVEKKRAASVMDNLEAAGATDILLSAVHSSRMGD